MCNNRLGFWEKQATIELAFFSVAILFFNPLLKTSFSKHWLWRVEIKTKSAIFSLKMWGTYPPFRLQHKSWRLVKTTKMCFCEKKHSTIIWLTFKLSDKILNDESSLREFYWNLSIIWHNHFSKFFVILLKSWKFISSIFLSSQLRWVSQKYKLRLRSTSTIISKLLSFKKLTRKTSRY